MGPWKIPYEQWPRTGLPLEVFQENQAELQDSLRFMRQAAAVGNISVVQDDVQEALDAFGIQLDENSPAYTKLGMAAYRHASGSLRQSRSATRAKPLTGAAFVRVRDLF